MISIFKSKLYREEILRWTLYTSLLVWALSSTYMLLKKNDKLVLIGIDESGTRLITDTGDRILQNELKSFFQEFLKKYYEYDEKSFPDQIESASNLMSSDLWETQKSKLLNIQEKLQKYPLSQSIEIESIDMIDNQKIEAILNIKINSKIAVKNVKLKVKLNFEKHSRNELNPWNYQITEVQDAQM